MSFLPLPSVMVESSWTSRRPHSLYPNFPADVAHLFQTSLQVPILYVCYPPGTSFSYIFPLELRPLFLYHKIYTRVREEKRVFLLSADKLAHLCVLSPSFSVL